MHGYVWVSKIFLYIGGAGADVVEDLVSGREGAATLVGRDVDGVVV